jgi:hypothetical protein
MKEKQFWEIRDGLDLGDDLCADAAAEAYRILVENWEDAWQDGYDPDPRSNGEKWTAMMVGDIDETIDELKEVQRKLKGDKA